MANARGLANHALYMAKLLLEAWQRDLARKDCVTGAIDAAFAPAVRGHLLDAYGWFLIAMMRITQLPEQPPHRVADLPKVGPGIAVPGEVLEYEGLEADGWLARLQAPLPQGLPKRPKGPVLASAGVYPNITDYREWADTCERLFDRMSDSLDEY
jgi:hypothetical protein